MKKWDFKNNPLFFTMLGMLIGSAAGYIEEWTNIPQIISVAVGFIIVMIPLFFWIKDWLKKKMRQLDFIKLEARKNGTLKNQDFSFKITY